jgi:pimeloyl-ACP methyl ester carboxylesterase
MVNNLNTRTSVVFALTVFATAICEVPEAAVAQSQLTRHENVRAGPAALQVTIRGKGEPIVFIPSRGRGIEDFDTLSNRLARAGYQVILPQPRGIGGSTGPLKDITYHDLASLSPLPAVLQPLLDMISAIESPGRWLRIIPAW